MRQLLSPQLTATINAALSGDQGHRGRTRSTRADILGMRLADAQVASLPCLAKGERRAGVSWEGGVQGDAAWSGDRVGTRMAAAIAAVR